MVAHDTFRSLGYIYSGLQLIGSLLLLINSSHLVAVGTGISIVSLLLATIALIFNIVLITGLIMRKAILVTIHQRYVTTVFVLLLISLFVGSIVAAIQLSAGDRIAYVVQREMAVIGITSMSIFLIILSTLYYSLVAWILNGVTRTVRRDTVRLVSSEGSD